MARLRPHARSPIWAGLYAVCLVCVLSFAFFEMLDVDGSDAIANFKTPTTPVRAGLRQSTTDGVRRVVLQAAALACPAVTIDLSSIATTALSAGRARPRPVIVVIGPRHRIALPRASLETASPV